MRFLTACVALWATHGILVAEPLKPRDGSWKLVWADEFDRDGPPNPEFWEFEHGFVRNRELQWYQPQNAVCRDGLLVIEARRERVHDLRHEPGSKDSRRARRFAQYTSASLITKPSHAWKYGRFEVRARFAAKPGLWPAIWTTGHGRWPASGEIDIMEYYRGMILANFAQADEKGRPLWNASSHPIEEFGPEKWDDSFHVWTMLWDENEIVLYLDGKPLNRHDLAKSFNGNDPEVNPFRAPHRMRLNLAIGGAGGDPSETAFPQRYEVDYVRIYQRE